MAEKTLLQLLNEAQREVKNPGLDGENPHFKNKYATLGECLSVVKEACGKKGVSVYFDIEDENVFTVVSDGKEEKRLAPFPANFSGTPQQNGSALTYAKRYSLCAAFGIAAEEDDDAEMAQTQPKTRNSQNSVNTSSTQKPTRKQAQNRLKKVLVEYYGGDKVEAEKKYNELWHTPGFEDTVEWFESYSNNLLVEMRANG